MGDPYIGEIRMFAGNFEPNGWLFCEGQLLPISEYETLFVLIGTTYGGNGESTFALPDLRGRIPVHMGTGASGQTYTLAENGGVERVTLSVNQMPVHNHWAAAVASSGSQATPGGAVWAASSLNQYSSNSPNANMHPAAIGTVGGSQPHENMPPYLSIRFIISLFGIFPSQT